MSSAIDALLADPRRMRVADADVLSLAFIDARNRTLRWLALFEGAPDTRRLPTADAAVLAPARWLAGHAAWYQERWIARNLQRARGPQADRGRAPLASIDPGADGWWNPDAVGGAARWHMALPDFGATRAYLADTLDVTVELLAGEDDDDLHWFRDALMYEDALVERFAALAQALGLEGAATLAVAAPVLPLRQPLLFGAQRFPLGSQPGGYVPPSEQWAHEEAVPEFEIDAQPVSWSQFVEFVEDGGYDEARWWHADGWAWVEREGRRSPRDVEQLRNGVLLRRFGLDALHPFRVRIDLSRRQPVDLLNIPDFRCNRQHGRHAVFAEGNAALGVPGQPEDESPGGGDRQRLAIQQNLGPRRRLPADQPPLFDRCVKGEGHRCGGEQQRHASGQITDQNRLSWVTAAALDLGFAGRVGGGAPSPSSSAVRVPSCASRTSRCPAGSAERPDSSAPASSRSTTKPRASVPL